MSKVWILVVSCLLVGVGCAAPRIQEEARAIAILRDAPSPEKYEVLGFVSEEFLPLLSPWEIEMDLRQIVYSRFGPEAHAIIRVSERIVPGLQFPLLEVNGTVVRFTCENLARRVREWQLGQYRKPIRERVRERHRQRRAR